MTASELSEQIKNHLEAGEYAQANALLMIEWRQRSEFGVARCNLPEYSEVWVRFKTSGYPFSLRREWEAADEEETFRIMAAHVEDWNLPDLSGGVVALDGDLSKTILDQVEESLLWWMVREFVNFWRVDLMTPRKNSSPPSVSMSSTAAASLLS